MPTEKDAFIKYSKEHPDMQWVRKGNWHRGIEIVKVEAITEYTSKGSFFIQRFIDNPLLIDGRRFSLGILTAVTSINPLRLYINEDWVVRFCKQPYHPFDPANKDKFI